MNKDKLLSNIDKAMNLLNDNNLVIPKIYLNCNQIYFKKFFEETGFEVIITDYLPNNIQAIIGNLENKEK